MKKSAEKKDFVDTVKVSPALNQTEAETSGSSAEIRLSRSKRLVLFLILALAVAITYSNHFNNGFHLDDSHAVVNNVYIQGLKNIPLFFKDANTFSSLPSNQSYRPIVTTTLAIDYWLGKGL